MSQVNANSQSKSPQTLARLRGFEFVWGLIPIFSGFPHNEKHSAVLTELL